MNRLLFTILILVATLQAYGQDWLDLHHTYESVDWKLPLKMADNVKTEFSNVDGIMTTEVSGADGKSFTFFFNTEELDSISFSYSLTDSEKGHNKYRPFTMHIFTMDGMPVEEREQWIDCLITLDGKGEYSDYSGTGRIRGRGNSSWDWYDKKPYKIKLDSKSKLLGLDKAKNWNLLANYRDVTDMMNTFAFETARLMGMPFTNHTRYVELFLNNEYVGLYQLTEKIEINSNRVDIDEKGGLLMSFDQDDGPTLSPEDGDNFFSQVYSLPMCVKSPEGLSATQLDSIRTDFAVLEKAIKAHDYHLADSLMDIASFISILQLHEYLYNVEIDAPRSIYMFKAPGGKYTFGPVWDWDAGYDFDWGNMYTGHTFFSDYRELIYGTDPLNAADAQYNISKFWRELFGNSTFVARYKDAWQQLSDSIFISPWRETKKYIDALTAEGAYTREADRWPMQSTTGGWWGSSTTVTFTPAEEIAKMERWLSNRKKYLDGIIASYPKGSDETIPDDFTVVGTINKSQNLSFRNGYTQSGSISVTQSEVSTLLGGTPTSLVPLNADGEEGTNTAAGTYGAWFDAAGNTVPWGSGHVFIESNSLYSWSYGCHPGNCSSGHSHTAIMQYRRGSKAVNVKVTFYIGN